MRSPLGTAAVFALLCTVPLTASGQERVPRTGRAPDDAGQSRHGSWSATTLGSVLLLRDATLPMGQIDANGATLPAWQTSESNVIPHRGAWLWESRAMGALRLGAASSFGKSVADLSPTSALSLFAALRLRALDLMFTSELSRSLLDGGSRAALGFVGWTRIAGDLRVGVAGRINVDLSVDPDDAPTEIERELTAAGALSYRIGPVSLTARLGPSIGKLRYQSAMRLGAAGFLGLTGEL